MRTTGADAAPPAIRSARSSGEPVDGVAIERAVRRTARRRAFALATVIGLVVTGSAVLLALLLGMD